MAQMGISMRYGFSITVVAAAAAWLAAYPRPAPAQQALPTIVPHPAWDCGMPDGIPQPERGNLIFEISLPLERVVDIGTTQYGERRVAIGLQGVVEGLGTRRRFDGNLAMPQGIEVRRLTSSGLLELLDMKSEEGTTIVHSLTSGPEPFVDVANGITIRVERAGIATEGYYADVMITRD